MPGCGVHLAARLPEQSSLHLHFLAKVVTKSLPHPGSVLAGLWG